MSGQSYELPAPSDILSDPNFVPEPNIYGIKNMAFAPGDESILIRWFPFDTETTLMVNDEVGNTPTGSRLMAPSPEVIDVLKGIHELHVGILGDCEIEVISHRAEAMPHIETPFYVGPVWAATSRIVEGRVMKPQDREGLTVIAGVRQYLSRVKADRLSHFMLDVTKVGNYKIPTAGSPAPLLIDHEPWLRSSADMQYSRSILSLWQSRILGGQ